MNRKDYQTPTMKVVKLQHQSHILIGSTQVDVNVSMNDTWEEEDI